MSTIDHVEHGLGILSLVTIGVIAGSAHVAVHAMVVTVRPQWRRIVRLAMGHVEEPARVEASFRRVG